MELDSESQHHPKSTLELERHVQLRGSITPLKAKRLVSHVEIFVSIRLLFGPPLAGAGSYNRFQFRLLLRISVIS